MIEGITGADVQKLIDIYSKAEKNVIKGIIGVDFFNRREKEDALNQIQDILQGLYGPTQRFLDLEARKEYGSGIAEVESALRDVDLGNSFRVVDPQALKFVLSNVDDILDTALSDVKAMLSNSYTGIQSQLNQVKKEVQNELISTIGTGQVSGQNRLLISEKLEKILTSKGITGFTGVTNKGKTIKVSMSAYVEALTRSTLINSRVSAVTSRALELGHDLLQISTHKNPSPMCAPWGGKIVSISGQTEGYPTLTEALFKGDYVPGGGILHRYCRHSVTVYIPTDIQFN